MRYSWRMLVVAAFLVGATGRAAPTTTKEAPPMEPPYTNKDTEFDQFQNEDPAASSQSAIPSSEDPTLKSGATKEPVHLRAGESSQEEPFATESPTAPPSASTAKKSFSSAPPKEIKSKTGVRMVHHPDAAKGLIRIEQDGTYVYKIPTKPKNQTGIVRLGSMSAPDITSTGNLTNFRQMYGSSLFTLLVDYEWHPFSSFGKQLGLQAGFGIGTAQGTGSFIDGNNNPPPLEKYTFFATPLNAGIVYRLEFWNKQWVAPYVSGGGTYIGVAELRDDGQKHFAGTPGAYGGGGLMFNLSAIDKDIAFAMDSEYGIGKLWVVAEYRYIQAFSDALNFTGSLVSVGFGADF